MNDNKNLASSGLYTIRDSKACLIGPLFTSRNDEEANRSFADIVRGGKDSLITRHPEDFVLLRVGEVDQETGVITALVPPAVLCSGSDFLIKE